jgi:hypothetical protein
LLGQGSAVFGVVVSCVGWACDGVAVTVAGSRCDAPIPAADPVDDQAAVFRCCLLPREVTRVERMDLAVVAPAPGTTELLAAEADNWLEQPGNVFGVAVTSA